MRLTWKKMQRDSYRHEQDYHLRLNGVRLATVSCSARGFWYWYGNVPGKPAMNTLWRKEGDGPCSWSTPEEAKADCKAAIKAQFEEGV